MAQSDEQQSTRTAPELMRLIRMLVLLAVFVLGGRYVLGLSTVVAVFGGATCAYLVALLINRTKAMP
jgi:hypothetical protein